MASAFPFALNITSAREKRDKTRRDFQLCERKSKLNRFQICGRISGSSGLECDTKPRRMRRQKSNSRNLIGGRKTSLANRQKRASLHDRMVWEYIAFVAFYAQPQTLREFAALLNAEGIRTARGGRWTPANVGHVFARHRTTAKEVARKYSEPSSRAPLPPIPTKTIEAFRRDDARINDPSERTGVWRSATNRSPLRADIVRHAEFGEGQFVAELRAGKLRCRFLDDEGTYDVVVPANQIEWFEYFRSREERQRQSEIVWARHFGESI